MDKNQIIKVWKDPAYRDELKKNNQDLPDHPAGPVSLTDPELGEIFGGVEEVEAAASTGHLFTIGCCTILKMCDHINTRGSFSYGCCE